MFHQKSSLAQPSGSSFRLAENFIENFRELTSLFFGNCLGHIFLQFSFISILSVLCNYIKVYISHPGCFSLLSPAIHTLSENLTDDAIA